MVSCCRHVLPRGVAPALHVGAAGAAVGAVRAGGRAAAVQLLRRLLAGGRQLAGNTSDPSRAAFTTPLLHVHMRKTYRHASFPQSWDFVPLATILFTVKTITVKRKLD